MGTLCNPYTFELELSTSCIASRDDFMSLNAQNDSLGPISVTPITRFVHPFAKMDGIDFFVSSSAYPMVRDTPLSASV